MSSNRLTFKEQKDGSLIILSKALSSRAQVLYLCYAIVFFVPSAILLIALVTEYFPISVTLFFLAGMLVCDIVCYRFFNKAFMSERLFLNKEMLKIIHKSLLKTTIASYEIPKISALRHLEKPEITPHPLAGPSFDYLGFQTEQAVINEMSGDNRIAFDYEGKTIGFGENLYSWDFEEIQKKITDVTGLDLQQPETLHQPEKLP